MYVLCCHAAIATESATDSESVTDLNSLDTTKFPPTSVITVSRVLAGTLTGVVVAVLLGVVIFCVSYFVCTRLHQMLKAQAGDQATAQHNVPVEVMNLTSLIVLTIL